MKTVRLLIASAVAIDKDGYFQALRPVIGERYWNDHEGIICVPIADLEKRELKQMENLGFPTEYLINKDYIICNLDNP